MGFPKVSGMEVLSAAWTPRPGAGETGFLLTSTLTAHLVLHHDLITCPAYQSVPTSKYSPPVTWNKEHPSPPMWNLLKVPCPTGHVLVHLCSHCCIPALVLVSSKPSTFLALLLLSAVDSNVFRH